MPAREGRDLTHLLVKELVRALGVAQRVKGDAAGVLLRAGQKHADRLQAVDTDVPRVLWPRHERHLARCNDPDALVASDSKPLQSASAQEHVAAEPADHAIQDNLYASRLVSSRVHTSMPA